MEHPKSEQTLKRHKYTFDIFEEDEKGVVVNKKQKYLNDLGYPCLYRVEIDGRDIMERVQYYEGRLVQVRQVFQQTK